MKKKMEGKKTENQGNLIFGKIIYFFNNYENGWKIELEKEGKLIEERYSNFCNDKIYKYLSGGGIDKVIYPVEGITEYYIYDENNVLAGIVSADENKQEIFRETFFPNKHGKVEYKIIESHGKKEKVEYEYDRNGNVIKELRYCEGKEDEITTNQYDEKNNIIYRHITKEGESDYQEWWEYDEHNNVVFNKSNNVRRVSYQYIYDDKGRVKVRIDDCGNKKMIEYLTIETLYKAYLLIESRREGEGGFFEFYNIR